MASYQVPTLFEPFHRLPTTGRHTQPGSRGIGLGLSIVRSVARAHDGDAHATPNDGGGPTVHVQLPAIAEGVTTGRG